MKNQNGDDRQFDWHYYETSLDRCVRRLQEIAEEAGIIGHFFTQRPSSISGSTRKDLINSATAWVNESRVPGYCGFKLAEEGVVLIHQVAARIAVLRKVYEKNAQAERLDRLDQIKALFDSLEPAISQSLQELAPYQRIDGEEILRAIVEKMKASK